MTTRRVFLSGAEVPGLLRGVLAGDATCFRRILGARRGGRYGALLAGVALLLAVSPADLAVPLIVHAGLSLAGHFAGRSGSEPRLGARQYQRVVLWALAIPLALSAPFRLVSAGAVPAILAIAVGHGLLWSGLRRGLGPLTETSP